MGTLDYQCSPGCHIDTVPLYTQYSHGQPGAAVYTLCGNKGSRKGTRIVINGWEWSETRFVAYRTSWPGDGQGLLCLVGPIR